VTLEQAVPVTAALPARRDAAPSLGAQALWLLAAKTIGFGLSVALPLVLVRRMSLEEFGLYKQVFLIVGTAVTVLPLGFGMSAFYFLPRARDRQGSIVVNIVLFHAAVGLVVSAALALAPGLLAWVFNNPALTPHARSIAFVVLLWTIGSFLEIVPVALQDVRASTAFIVTSQFSKTTLLLLAAVTVGTIDALIAAAMLQGLVQIAMMLGYMHARFPGFWSAFDGGLLRAQATYALPVGGSGLLLKLQDDIHHAFVSNAFGPALYAVYAIGVFKLPLFGILRESVGSVVLPRINELECQNERRQILMLVAASARKLALVYYPLYAYLMLMGPEVLAVLFTESYVSAWPVFAIALTVVPFSVVVLDPVTRAPGERYFFLRLRLVIFTALGATLWLFAERLGLTGVITTVVAASLLGWAIAVHRMGRLLEAGRRDLGLFAPVARIAAAAAAAALATALVRPLVAGWPAWAALVACLPVFAAVYAAGIAFGRVLQPAEMSALAQEVTRVIMRRPRAVGHPAAVRDGRGRPLNMAQGGGTSPMVDAPVTESADRPPVAPAVLAWSPAIEPAGRPRDRLYVTGGQQRSYVETDEWKQYGKALIVAIDSASGEAATCVEYVSPPDVCPDEEPSITFKAGTLAGDRLYVCTSTEVLVYQVPDFRVVDHISLPCFNDLHHVRPTRNGSLIVANTGLDMVVEVGPDGRRLREWHVLGCDPWTSFSPHVDYRKVATTKPHRSHPNHVFTLGDEIWVTRFNQRDAICVNGEDRMDIVVQRPHDGTPFDGLVYFTTVDGHVVVVDQRSRKTEAVVDLNPPGADGMLGWCRGLSIVDRTHVWVGFSRFRPTKFQENVSWIKSGLRRRRKPTHMALYDLANGERLREIELESLGLHTVFSIVGGAEALRTPEAASQVREAREGVQ
jgi:O-antigen/teichoic acid export membrane protein